MRLCNLLISFPTEFYDAVVKSQKKVDILVNNSGIIRDKEPDLTIAVNFVSTAIKYFCRLTFFDRVFISQTSVVKNCLVAIERMGKHKSGHGGTIVNVSSHAALINTPILPVYAATKQAVINFTTNLRVGRKINSTVKNCLITKLIHFCVFRNNTSTPELGPWLFVPARL